MRRYGILLLPLLIVVVLGFVGVTTADSGGRDVAADDDGGGAAGSVDIANFAFGPMDVTVAAGTPVTWTNRDGSPHAIQDDTGDDLFAESDELDQGDTFSFTYAEPGTYAYICGIHNYMQGTVTVTG
jgi:plastocyanin